MPHKLIVLILIIALSKHSFAQENRLTDHNSIGWLVYTGTFKINPEITIHTEYQWRRADGLKNWQQSLLRTGVNYVLRKDVNLNAGYAFAETFPYGEYPVATAFPEHRIFEQIVLKILLVKQNYHTDLHWNSGLSEKYCCKAAKKILTGFISIE